MSESKKLKPNHKMFKLRTVIECHSMDVRAVCAYPGGGFVTASRDTTAKVYMPKKEPSHSFEQVQLLTGPGHYAVSVCVLEDKQKGEHIIYIGSNDSIIYSYTIHESTAKKQLQGHSGTVCALACDQANKLLVSGSWDTTAIVWKDEKSFRVLAGHSAAIWATAFIGHLVLTASADKSIKIWTLEPGTKCQTTLTGHTDCVRGLSVVNAEQFLSVANDATVRLWDTKGSALGVYSGHENYIYSISSLNAGEYTTCSEDRTFKVWNGCECVQTVRLPAPTLWNVAGLHNHPADNDVQSLVVGTSDGKAYVYTRLEKLQASEGEQKKLQDEVSNSKLPMTELGDIKVADLPGREVLSVPGKKDADMKIIREGDGVTVYSWSAADMVWTKIGDAVGAKDDKKDPAVRPSFEGKEYDFVFSVDIKDGEPALKLPYNVCDDAWAVAQAFIHKHELSQTYLEQVANFITTNSSSKQPAKPNAGGGTAAYDPFTGGSRYVPGAGSASKATPKRSSSPDPFTGGTRYVPGSGATGNATSKAGPTSYLFPQTTFVVFETGNIEGIAGKLREFNQHVAPNVKLTNEDMQTLLALTDTTREVSDKQVALIKLLIQWPKAYIFPALDLLRLSVLLPKINEDICASKDSAQLIDTILVCATDETSTPNQISALRVLGNLFQHPVGRAFVETHASTIFKAVAICSKAQNKNIQIAYANLFLNYAVSMKIEKDSTLKLECLTAILSSLRLKINSEAQFRFLVAFGTMIDADIELRKYSKTDEVYKILDDLVTCKDPEKVGKCATQIREFLK